MDAMEEKARTIIPAQQGVRAYLVEHYMLTDDSAARARFTTTRNEMQYTLCAWAIREDENKKKGRCWYSAWPVLNTLYGNDGQGVDEILGVLLQFDGGRCELYTYISSGLEMTFESLAQADKHFQKLTENEPWEEWPRQEKKK
jgi:hypothetical protein